MVSAATSRPVFIVCRVIVVIVVIAGIVCNGDQSGRANGWCGIANGVPRGRHGVSMSLICRLCGSIHFWRVTVSGEELVSIRMVVVIVL